MSKNIILFIGRKGCGKDTCYNILNTNRMNGYRHVSFAEPLREAVWDLFHNKIWDRDRLWGAIDKKEEPIEGWEIPATYGYKEKYWTGRRLLQWFGTDICRTIYGTIWVDKAIDEINSDEKDVVITDCRFHNEFDAIMSNFGDTCLVYPVAVDRPQSNNGYSSHASEADIPALMEKCVYHINNNGTLDDLKKKVIETEKQMAFHWLM